MSNAQNPTIYETVTARIIDALERGTIPWTKPWRTSNPCNAETTREYRGINKVLLWLVAEEKGYSSKGWLTYQQAKSLGGQVRRGEKATPVVWWSESEAKIQDEGADTQASRKFWVARCYHVFNLEQADGLDTLRAKLDTPVLDFHPLYQCDRMVKDYGADIRHAGDEAFYSRLGDFIQLPLWELFTSRESYYATLAHELVHHSGAAHRLNRDHTGSFGSETYAREELIAEMGSAFLTAQLGIPHQTRANAGYIASWLKILKGDKRAVFQASKLAQQAADYILEQTDECGSPKPDNESPSEELSRI